MNSSPRPHLRTVCTVIAGALSMISLTACNGLFHPEDFPTSGSTVKATKNPQEVSAKDFGHSWKLKVDHGTVSCDKNTMGDPVLRFIAPDGTKYALNSVDGNSELPPISDIADGSIGTLRSFAFKVCDV